MATDLKREIGQHIAEARLMRGLTQEALAELTGRSVEAISNLERGKSFPSAESLQSLSEHLGVAVRDFFGPAQKRPDRRKRLETKGQALLHSLTDDFLEIALDQLAALHRRGARPASRQRKRWPRR